MLVTGGGGQSGWVFVKKSLETLKTHKHRGKYHRYATKACDTDVYISRSAEREFIYLLSILELQLYIQSLADNSDKTTMDQSIHLRRENRQSNIRGQ